jgi:hypothetical protein
MKTYPFARTLLGAALVVALATAPVLAQTGSTDGSASSPTTATDGQAAVRLSGTFATFAGSDANAQALVDGLRNGTPVTLDQAGTNPDGTTSSSQVTFQPATGPLGYGNVKIALSLAEASLAQAGITDPTAEELAAALNGGTLTLADGTSVDMQGVLAARAAGEGWGQIAKAMGFKLGDVMRSPKAVGSAAAGTHANARVAKVVFASGAHAGQADAHADAHLDAHASVAAHPERPAMPEHAQHPDRPQRPERPQLPSRPDVPTHAGRPGG